MMEKSFELVHLTPEQINEIIKQANLRGAVGALEALESRLQSITLESRRIRGILTEHQAARELGISRDTLRRWRREYDIPTYKIGQQVFFLYDDLVELVRNNRTK